MTNFIRIMIADDYEIIREGIKRVLEFEDNIKVVAESVDGNDVINQVKILKPDVLLLDMSMPGHSGLEILKFLRDENLEIKVIILTIERGADIINAAIEAGADGYVVKESTTAEIVEAINTVYQGKKYLDKSLMGLMFNKYNHQNKESIFDELSKRELEITYWISKGYSNREIAGELFLSEKTIKNNLTRIFKKLEVKDRVHAAVLAVTNDIESHYNRD
ncbi:MAG: response regulator transcription factor [Clostridiales bacterium]|nr:response regulator transcription factor [Clostridiales bacterium]